MSATAATAAAAAATSHRKTASNSSTTIPSSATSLPTTSSKMSGSSSAVSVASSAKEDLSPPPPQSGNSETKGWLYKWTNYIKGYQKRWFVLSNGLLSYYRNQAEMSHTCRGTISLHGANVHTEDSCNFIVSNGGGTQSYHLR